tara:strand:- start:4211 stop:4678 length:468 start_codon:yes stop_codon:yes gene_type:complete
MIITCEKCSKKFNIQDSLIPEEGRQLQCGSCNYKWFFQNKTEIIKLEKEIFDITPTKSNKIIAEENKIKSKIKINEERKVDSNIINKKNKIKNTKKESKIIKNTLVVIFSIIAFIVLIDTFKYQLNNYIPGIDLILNNLYESLKDFSLFFKNLID